jgi:hypothetical protein
MPTCTDTHQHNQSGFTGTPLTWRTMCILRPQTKMAERRVKASLSCPASQISNSTMKGRSCTPR